MNLKETAQKYTSLSCYSIEIHSSRPAPMILTLLTANITVVSPIPKQLVLQRELIYLI
ncbi:hypothetical protein AwErysi_06450 [Erysipelotrichaceae bacterium]|nr:hypothetical protein AwErysi_06450 [Erysipelotrichaceae bacterium]